MPVSNGSQLIGMFTGAPSSGLNLETNVGPNALLVSGSYPVPSDGSADTGPLTQVPLPEDYTYWRVDDGGSGQFTMPDLWTSPDAGYVYSNDPANLGGIVPDGGLVIDGYPVAAGVYVFQFMDFSLGSTIYCVDGPPILLRGCRWRPSTATAPGFVNVASSYEDNSVLLHYCDIGGQSSAVANLCETGIDLEYGTNCRALRNYLSYLSTNIQMNASGYNDTIENFMEKLTLFDVSYHLNGITLNGGNENALILRNSAVFVSPDEQGNLIQQTDCIALFEDFGYFPGTGTNSDGSMGYWIEDNYVGGTGYCYYLGYDTGDSPSPDYSLVQNIHFNNNEVTSSVYDTAGYFGAVTAQPLWGSYGNSYSGNVWADGPLKGALFVGGIAYVQDSGGYESGDISVEIDITSTGGNTLVAAGLWIGTAVVEGLTSVTDSAGNEWAVSLTPAQTPPTVYIDDTTDGYYFGNFVAYVQDAQAVTSVTVTMPEGTFIRANISEWQNVATPGPGITSSALHSDANGDAVSGILNIAAAAALVIGAACCPNTFSLPSSMTEFDSEGSVYLGYAAGVAAASFSATWAGPGSAQAYTTAVMAFYPQPGPSVSSGIIRSASPLAALVAAEVI